MANHKPKESKPRFDTLACGKKMMKHFGKEMRNTISKALETQEMLKRKYGKHIVQLF
jgi:hypothetical protein